MTLPVITTDSIALASGLPFQVRPDTAAFMIPLAQQPDGTFAPLQSSGGTLLTTTSPSTGEIEMGAITFGGQSVSAAPVILVSSTNTATATGISTVPMAQNQAVTFTGSAVAVCPSTGDRAYWDNINFKVYQGALSSNTSIDSSSGFGTATVATGGTGGSPSWQLTLSVGTDCVNVTAIGSAALTANFVLEGTLTEVG